MENKKNISFKVDSELHKNIKLKATNMGIGIKEYILNLIKKDLESEEK
ncbi:hypothetical protein JMUB3936_p1040 (plasmid) [Leptotrichia wadei]|jgi:hypothetical protein|uniref:Uncharacterized protein n=1 Tax=Leptotrichia wadei TaxID=157687 RepID=A0A510KU05_9FUSO|nr:hypothetical protein [Leptotrichia wadei]BBM55106.1 hypothetical protein JMUB3936_1390 [Leptotrichia wadei]BBM55968.1 hypothetical protein JMUB3936_p1040 [Leptotrichia wadei]DAT05250.1 MAG TPA: antitoxin [Caudoviricetes sp.]DAX69948.1 MAG TPA: antitoxin [Caudoviricetes sp.]